MPRLKRLSGTHLVKIFSEFGFSTVRQKGSHVKIRRTLSDGTTQNLTIPLHDELDTGTCRAILRQAKRFIPIEDLRKLFYTG